MPRNNHFRHGDRVNGVSLSGKRVFGEYRGMRASFGALVFGVEEGCTELAMHTCLVLSLERPKIKHDKPGRPRKYKTKLQAGDPCESVTKSGTIIQGKFMNIAGQFSWIKGWPEGSNRLDPPQAYKVLTEHLVAL